MTFLDIGCGWGTLVRHAAKKFGAKATGVTLSAEGAAWCRGRAEADGLSPKQCEILNCDYREIPSERKFDCISAVEMAEHVGLANFGLFLGNVRDMLEDDGIFYMQVAGLRKGSNWQDTQWGLFMSRYIFPGADASPACARAPTGRTRSGASSCRATSSRVPTPRRPAQGLQLAGHAVGPLHVALHLPGCR